jgi:hypothetical protein
MLRPGSPAFRIRIFAALAVVLVFAAIGVTLRCATPGLAACSFATFFGEGPKLDVPYAATRPETVELMLDMAEVGPGDFVIDLGTGDGRILIAAARDHGARGVGVDIDPVMIRRAQAAARHAGVADRVRFEVADLFEMPLGEADVVTMYLLPEVNLRLRPRLLAELRPGARVVSHAFDMGDWRPEESRRAWGTVVHRWTIPARADVGEQGRAPQALPR